MDLNINIVDLMVYDSDEERENGTYWAFANMSEEELIHFFDSELVGDYFGLTNLGDIICNIQNPKLKEKMKSQVLFVINQKRNLDYIRGQIFDVSEIKNLVDSYIEEHYGSEKSQDKIVDIIRSYDDQINDEEWIFNTLEKLYQNPPTKDRKGRDLKQIDITKLRLRIIFATRNTRIQQRLIEAHRTDFPQDIQNFFEFKKDRQYVLKKKEQYSMEETDLEIDSSIMIGAEIECNNDYGLQPDFLSQEGIKGYSHRADVTTDLEIASRPFRNTREDVADFRAVLESLQDMGFYYDEVRENSAGQLNVGLESFESPQAFLIFMELFGNSEEVLYHIANEEGQLLRQTVHHNSRFKPISEIIGTRVVNEDIEWKELCEMFEPSDKYGNRGEHQIKGLRYKKDSICLRDRNRVEIRIFNGSTKFQTWKENIMLIGKMVEKANLMAKYLRGDIEASERTMQIMELEEELKEPDLTLEEKLYTLMDILFEEDEEEKKSIYTNRFYTLEQMILQTGTKKYERPEMKYREPGFGIVDFIPVYKSQIERHHGAISLIDLEAGKNETVR